MSRNDFFQGCRIEVVQFPQHAGGDLIAERKFSGPIHQQVRESINYVKDLGGTLIEKVPGQAEVDRFLPYPFEAIEEAVVNAVFHRSYQFPPEPVKIYIYPDRMEITSYPGPLPGIKKEHILKGEVPAFPLRNRRIGDFLKELRLAEARGTGIPKIIHAMKENGSPPPVFDFDEQRTYFCVKLPIHPRHRMMRTLRTGNGRKEPNKRYIFTFGNTGAGKSTLMAALAYVLFQNYKIVLNFNNTPGNMIMNSWLLELRNSQFPNRTRTGIISEINLGLKSDDGDDLALTFLEMAGEDLRKLDFRETEGLNQTFLNYAVASEIFLVVVPFDRMADDDLLVWMFFNRLIDEGLNMSRVVLVISKWDMNSDNQDLDQLVKHNLPQTYRWLKSFYKEQLPIFPFSIGRVGGNKIEKLHLDNAETVLTQILQLFTP